jgi:hypothetical protein
VLVTTDKDRVRIEDDWIKELPLWVIGVSLDFALDRAAFERRVFAILGMNNPREERL